MNFLQMVPETGWSFWKWVEYFVIYKYPEFINGAIITLIISISGTILGFLIGLVVAVFRNTPEKPTDSWIKIVLLRFVKFLMQVYIEIFRGTPMIVQAMVIYYGTASVFHNSMNRLFAGILIVSINTGAYLSEIVRGGIEAVDKGQYEAAHTIGLRHRQTMRHIVLPQAIRNIMPAIGNEFVINIKDTSVLSVISVTELFFTSKSIAGTYYKYFETFIITCTVYFILTFTVTRILRVLEKKMDGPSSYSMLDNSDTSNGKENDEIE